MSRPIQTSGPAGQLEKLTGVKGGLALRLDEVIVPVSMIVPQRRKYAIGFGLAVAAVGFRSEVALVNPLPFGPSIEDTSIWIHKIWATLVTATNRIELVRTDGGITGAIVVATKSFVDLPLGSSPAGVLSTKSTAVATAGTVISQQRALANTTVIWDVEDTPFVLDTTNVGAHSLLVRPGSDNELMDVSFLWSEPADLL